MKIEELKTIKDVEALIAFCNANCGGYIKVNLDRGRGAQGNGEGVWAVPVSPEDRAIYDDERSRGQKFKVYLCNVHIGEDGWHGRTWACPVIATTFGENRPVAFAADQSALNAEVAHIKAVIAAQNNEPKQKESDA